MIAYLVQHLVILLALFIAGYWCGVRGAQWWYRRVPPQSVFIWFLEGLIVGLLIYMACLLLMW